MKGHSTLHAISIAFAITIALALPSILHAQSVPNLELNSTEEGDSLRSTQWDHFFPLWGAKVIERGYELPLPIGLNIQWLSQSQDMSFKDLHLGVNNSGLVDVSDFIKIGKSNIVSHMAQFRADLWILPFLNVYGLVGGGTNAVDVTIGAPVEFKAVVDRDALLAGFGGNVSFGVQRYFAVVDGNLSWADVEGVDDLTHANVVSGRIGRSFRLKGQKRLAGWMGAMRLGLGTNTSGSIRIGDVLPGIEDFFDNYQSEQWYQDLPPGQKIAVDQIFTEIAARGPGDATIQYSLDKQLAGIWSMLLGGQYQFSPHWMFRAEYAQSEKRGSILLNLNYRFGL
jgi:hypothetical protein